MTAVSDFCDRSAHPPGGDVAGAARRTGAIGLVRAAMDLAQSQSLDIRPALREAGIPPGGLIGQDAARITGAQAARLIQALREATDDELLGVAPHRCPAARSR
jgi:hypothetical protein